MDHIVLACYDFYGYANRTTPAQSSQPRILIKPRPYQGQAANASAALLYVIELWRKTAGVFRKAFPSW